jgi:sulfite reductase beta subunit-like hemoprotein
VCLGGVWLALDSVGKWIFNLLEQYAQHRQDKEYFGDFVIRTNLVKASKGGLAFHQGQ